MRRRVKSRVIGHAVIWVTAIALGALLIHFLVPGRKAYGHSFYDNACCHDRDCGPATATTKIQKGDGGFWVTHGNWPAKFFRNDQVRDSQDARWHVCIRPGGTPMCLYAPAGA